MSASVEWNSGMFFDGFVLAHVPVRQPEMPGGMCEDDRAAGGIDLGHDREGRARGDKLPFPMLVSWGAKGKTAAWHVALRIRALRIRALRIRALGIWRAYCANEVTGGPVTSGHYIAEGTPGELPTAFGGFF
jgi:haloacetate dehalogenase